MSTLPVGRHFYTNKMRYSGLAFCLVSASSLWLSDYFFMDRMLTFDTLTLPQHENKIPVGNASSSSQQFSRSLMFVESIFAPEVELETSVTRCSLKNEQGSSFDVNCSDLAGIVLSAATTSVDARPLSISVRDTSNITVAIVGGSISCGHGASEGYGAILSRYLQNANALGKDTVVTIKNFCTPASGPDTILNAMKCGMKVCADADILIVEFSLNELSVEKMEYAFSTWTNQCSSSVVVLNLWSWNDIEQQGGNFTIQTAPVRAALQYDDIPIVDFRGVAAQLWQRQHLMRASTLFDCELNFEPVSCHSGQQFNNKGLKGLQHGNVVFHQLTAASLAFSIATSLVTRSTNNETNQKYLTPSSLCYGLWGFPLYMMPQYEARRKLESTVHSLESLVTELPNSWGVGAVGSNPDKMSLHTWEVLEPVSVRVPSIFHTVTIGYVAHSSIEESAEFTISFASEALRLSTRCEGSPGIRIAASEKIELPQGTDSFTIQAFSFATTNTQCGSRNGSEAPRPKLNCAVLEIISTVFSK